MSITLKSLGYETPDGSEIFCNINLTLERETKYGLVGCNGVGKTTLARIIAGELEPTNGSCHRSLSVQYFRQEESPPIQYQHLSGGQWTKLRLDNVIRESADFFIFDEPTNSLDRDGRELFTQFVDSYSGGLLLISHDRKLLQSVDIILELTNLGLNRFGGNWSFYEEQSRLEKIRQEDRLEKSKQALKTSLVKRAELRNRQEKRARAGKARAQKRGLSKIEVGGRKRRAQTTFGRIDKNTLGKFEDAVQESRATLSHLKTSPIIYAEFPETKVAHSQLVIEAQGLNFRYSEAAKSLWSEPLSFVIRGPAKVAVEGANGSGKSTLLRLMTNPMACDGQISGHLRLGGLDFCYVDQALQLIDSQKSVLENVLDTSQKSPTALRNLLAQFLFAGHKVEQIAGTLSGGEKLRLALAKALLSDPAPQLLILDEPTNNIDVYNLEFIEAALLKFQGALIVVSHDTTFLDKIGISHRIILESNERSNSKKN